MAFSLFRIFGHPGTKLVPAPTKADSTPATRGAVLKKTLPSRSLFDTKNPMPWVEAVATDVTRWRNK